MLSFCIAHMEHKVLLLSKSHHFRKRCVIRASGLVHMNVKPSFQCKPRILCQVCFCGFYGDSIQFRIIQNVIQRDSCCSGEELVAYKLVVSFLSVADTKALYIEDIALPHQTGNKVRMVMSNANLRNFYPIHFQFSLIFRIKSGGLSAKPSNFTVINRICVIL